MKEYGSEWDRIIGVSKRRDRTSLLWTDGRGKQRHVSSPATITFDRVARDNGYTVRMLPFKVSIAHEGV